MGVDLIRRGSKAIDIRKGLKKYLPHLLQAQADNLNEADTVQRIMKVLEDVLGYDSMTEITRESSVKDKFCDIALKIEGRIRILIEAKSAATVLRDRHTEQAQAYAAHGNIPWVVLTNGVTWNLYHLTFGEGIESTLAWTVTLSEGIPENADYLLSLLHRNCVKKDGLEEYWSHRVALGPASVARALFTEEALRFIRREIRRREGITIDEEDLAAAIHAMFSAEARERVGPLKIRRRRKTKTVASGAAADQPIPEAAEPPKDEPK